MLSKLLKILPEYVSIPRSWSRPLLMVKEQTVGANVVLPVAVCGSLP